MRRQVPAGARQRGVPGPMTKAAARAAEGRKGVCRVAPALQDILGQPLRGPGLGLHSGTRSEKSCNLHSQPMKVPGENARVSGSVHRATSTPSTPCPRDHGVQAPPTPQPPPHGAHAGGGSPHPERCTRRRGESLRASGVCCGPERERARSRGSWPSPAKERGSRVQISKQVCQRANNTDARLPRCFEA